MTVSTLRKAHRAWVEVNLASMLANARTTLAAARGAGLLPMVKADAYGLGAVPVAQALEAVEPWGFGVATVDEAIELRNAGILRPILVLTPAQSDLLPVFREYDLRAVLEDPSAAAQWDRAFHVEFDTGMGRCGVRWDAATAIGRFRSQYLEGAFTHLYAADEAPQTVASQWKRFQRALAALGSRPELVHVANSAGLWRLEQHLDLVRPGIFLYGGCHAVDLVPPLPVAALRAPVVSVRRLPAGATVSYGGDWTAPRETVIATLAIGYADGVPRAVARRAQVLLGGSRRPVVGRVTMDFIMVDLETDDGPSVKVGDVATLVGGDDPMAITIDEFASWAGTNAYEVLARLGPRLPREYLSG